MQLSFSPGPSGDGGMSIGAPSHAQAATIVAAVSANSTAAKRIVSIPRPLPDQASLIVLRAGCQAHRLTRARAATGFFCAAILAADGSAALIRNALVGVRRLGSNKGGAEAWQGPFCGLNPARS